MFFYNDLTKISPCDFVQTTTCATYFVLQKLFEACLPKQCIIESIDSCTNEHKDYIQQLIQLCLKNFAEGFSVQRGVIYIFGFDQNAEGDTGTLLKISSVSEESEMKQLNKLPINNLGDVRKVLSTMNYT